MSGKSKYFTERIVSEGKLSDGTKYQIVKPGILAVIRVVEAAIKGKTQYDINLACLTIFCRIEGKIKPEDYFLNISGVDYIMLSRECKRAAAQLKEKQTEQYRELLQKLQN
jgi:hypothetical protein